MITVLILISIIATIVAVCCIVIRVKEDTATREKNKEISAENQRLESRKDFLLSEVKDTSNEIQRLCDALFDKQEEFNRIKENTEKYSQNQIEMSNKAFENYCEVLNNKYKETEEEMDRLTDTMESAYSLKQLKLIAETDEIRSELDKIRSTRAAALEAFRREELMKANPEDYCIRLLSADKSDIARMLEFSKTLNNPRTMLMAIWSSYIRTPLKTLCDKTFGTEEVCGIYKLTVGEEVYIGQSVRCKERASEHFKRALGIDASATSKLYNFLQKHNIWEIQIELLEKCDKELLDEKEKYYIGLYQSDKSLNSTKGNG